MSKTKKCIQKKIDPQIESLNNLFIMLVLDSHNLNNGFVYFGYRELK